MRRLGVFLLGLLAAAGAIAACGRTLAESGGVVDAGTQDAPPALPPEAAAPAAETGPGLPPGSCEGNLCDCNGDPSDGREIDVMDGGSAHCGACNRFCPGAECLPAGVCRMGTLVDRLEAPRGIWAFENVVFFTELGSSTIASGNVFRVPLRDGAPYGQGPVRINDTAMNGPRAMTGTDGGVYFAVFNSNNVRFLPATCTGQCMTAFATGLPTGLDALGVEPTGSLLATTRDGGESDSFRGVANVYRIAADGGREVPLWRTTSRGPFTAIATDGKTIFVADSSLGVIALPRDADCSGGVCGTLLVQYREGGDVNPGLALDGDRLFVTLPSEGSILRVPTGGGAPIPVALDQRGLAYSPIVHGGQLFWLVLDESSTLTVMQSSADCTATPTLSCGRPILSTSSQNVLGFAVTSSNVFVLKTVGTGGAVSFGPR